MAFRVTAKIEGLEPLIKKMGVMKASLRRKVLREAMRKATSLVNKAAKRRAKSSVGPNATGMLEKSLGVKVKTYPSGIVIGVVQPREGFRTVSAQSARIGRRLAARGFGGGGVRTNWSGQTTYHDPRFIAHFIERGTGPRFNKRSGAYRGRVIARPFMGPAFTDNVGYIVEIFEHAIDMELRKL